MRQDSDHFASDDADGSLGTGRRLRPVAMRIALLLVVMVTMAAFVGVVQNDFVDWDDDYALLRNDAYRGLTWPHLRWMFTTGYTGHYQPLTWLSFAIDTYVWGGVSVAGFHLTSLLLHVIAGVGFFFVSIRLLSAVHPYRLGRGGNATILGALFAALLFAVHPLRVESVAWATERRDVLGGAWLMATMLLYLRAVDRTSSPRRRRIIFALSIVCYTASLLSKASAITLPVVLLLLDVYPLGRLGRSATADTGTPVRRIIIEKTLFAVPAVLIAVIALWAQAGAGAMRSLEEHPITLRIGQALFGAVFYVWKTVWPTGLIPLYEQDPHATALDPANLLSAVLVVAACALVWMQRRRWPALIIGWGAYLCLLAPVLGLAQSGPQVVADRYSYFSCLPWAVLVGSGVAWVWNRLHERRLWRAALICAMSAAVVSMTLATRAQTRIWADTETLWRTVIDQAPKTGTAHANLAAILNKHGDYDGARDHSQRALHILPGNRVAHFALARSSAELGDLSTAEQHYRIALEIRPNDPATMVNLAAVRIRLGLYDQAEKLYRDLIALQPAEAAWHYNLGSFLASRERFDEARQMFEETLRRESAYLDTHFRLGVVLLKLEEPGAAIAVLEEGLRLAPNDTRLATKLAWVLATCKVDELRDGRRAAALAEPCVAAGGETSVASLEALAAALGETGDFARAIETLDSLLRDNTRTLPPSMVSRLQSQLKGYQQRQPVRE